MSHHFLESHHGGRANVLRVLIFYPPPTVVANGIEQISVDGSPPPFYLSMRSRMSVQRDQV